MAGRGFMVVNSGAASDSAQVTLAHTQSDVCSRERYT
jgi:hypothetical protein